MNETKMFKILKRLVDRTEIEHIAENIIFDNDGVYELYNQYSISKSEDGYIVNKKNIHLNQWFFSIRNAVIWISLDKRNRTLEAKDVLSLDNKLASAVYNMRHYSELSRKAVDLEKKSLYVCKYTEGSVKKRHTMEKLNEYAQETKRWQDRKFAEVTKY